MAFDVRGGGVHESPVLGVSTNANAWGGVHSDQ